MSYDISKILYCIAALCLAAQVAQADIPFNLTESKVLENDRFRKTRTAYVFLEYSKHDYEKDEIAHQPIQF